VAVRNARVDGIATARAGSGDRSVAFWTLSTPAPNKNPDRRTHGSGDWMCPVDNMVIIAAITADPAKYAPMIPEPTTC